MFKYIRADLYRIFRQPFRYIWIGLCTVIMVAIHLSSAMNNDLNSIGFAASVHGFLSFAGVICGVGELTAIFSDDFRAKTMQIAIGSGVSRRHVVLAKLLEMIFLVLLDMLVIVVLMLLSGIVVMGISFPARPILQMLVEAFSATLTATFVGAVTMILMFYTQKSGLASLLFLVLYFDPIAQVLNLLLQTNELYLRLHIDDYTLSSLVGTINTQLGLGSGFPAKQLIIMAVYIAAAYFITCLVFQKRELDF